MPPKRKRARLTRMQQQEILDMMHGVLPPTHPHALTVQEQQISRDLARIRGTSNRYYHDTRANMYFS